MSHAQPLSKPAPRSGELRAVLQLGWPMVLTQLFIMATGFLDTAMAGQYSAQDLAGVALGANVMWPVFMLLTGITMALTPIASQLRGAGKPTEIGHQARQGLWISVTAGAVLVAVILSAGPLYRILAIDPATAEIAVSYLAAVAWGAPALVVYVGMRQVCEGLGQTRPPMLIAAAVLPVNAFLNYAFIYGHFGFPELGGVGCGWATAIVFWLQLGLMLLVIRLPFFRQTGFFTRIEGPDWQTIKQIFRIGMPIGFTTFLEMTVFSVVSLMVAGIGVYQMAAHSIAGNLNWLTFVIPMSIGGAASIRVGFHVGAGRFAEARQTSATIFKFAIGYALAVSVLLVTFRYLLVGVYTTDAQVIEIAVVLLVFIAVYQLVDDSQAVIIGALRGYKDTQVPMYISLIGYWVIALPVGHALSREWILPGLAPGVYGYWCGLTLGLSIVAVSVGIRLRLTSGDPKRIARLASSSA